LCAQTLVSNISIPKKENLWRSIAFAYNLVINDSTYGVLIVIRKIGGNTEDDEGG